VPNPIHAKTADSGLRKYVDPVNGMTYDSVTSILAAVAKPGLTRWAALAAAEYAVANLPHLVTKAKLDRAAAVQEVKSAPWDSRDRAAKLGSAVHEAAEAWMLDKPMPSWPDGVEPYMEQFVEWLADFSPVFELCEATVCNPARGYAGTLDAIASVPSLGQTLVIDYKTGKGIYAETALQLAAYRHATEVWMPAGGKAPMPATDGAAVLHLRPGGYAFVPVDSGPLSLSYFKTFTDAYRWMQVDSKLALDLPYAVPSGGV
jgi:hypothetical protein